VRINNLLWYKNDIADGNVSITSILCALKGSLRASANAKFNNVCEGFEKYETLALRLHRKCVGVGVSDHDPDEPKLVSALNASANMPF